MLKKSPARKKTAFHEQHEIMLSPSRQGVREGLPSYSTKSGQCLLLRLGGGKGTKSQSSMPRSQLGGGGSSLAAAVVAVVAAAQGQRRQLGGGSGGSLAAAAWRWQLGGCGRQRGGGGGSLAAAAWRQRQIGSRALAAWQRRPAAWRWRRQLGSLAVAAWRRRQRGSAAVGRRRRQQGGRGLAAEWR